MKPSDQSESNWDAGLMGCGELVLELRNRLNRLAPGAAFRLIAHDPGVPEDLPAWCRMTGHRLIRAEPPEFVIERRAN
ncbi:MAG TPA: sulfurtransferase TusA family protein [Pirellulales bacterium]|nr:sulfurtransferase TusA family protein [Pirellulales bacterium]